jgi:nicotinate-nucleotide adenylyltransferase
VSEKRDLWIPALLAAAGVLLLAWNLSRGMALAAVVAGVAGLGGAVASLPIRVKRGQRALVGFGLGVLLLLVPTIPGATADARDAFPWLVVALAFLMPLGPAAERIRTGLLGGAGLLALLALSSLAGILPRGTAWLFLAGALHLAIQVLHSRPPREPEVVPGPRICVFGGTFDPFHRAHRALCEAALKVNERLLIVVAGSPPHKEPADSRTDFHHRVAMTRLGVEGLGRTEVLELEGKRPGPSYTVDTLDALRRAHPPEARFRLLLGADMFQTFPTWHDWEGILDRATLLVAARPGWDLDPPPEFEGRNAPIERLEAPTLDIASSRLREDLAAGREVGDRVSPSVQAYIRDHVLYRGASGAPAIEEGTEGAAGETVTPS